MKMTRQEAINYIREYANEEDLEKNKEESDRAVELLLLSLGYSDVVEEWRKVTKKRTLHGTN